MKLKKVGSNMTELQLGHLRVLVSYSTPVACQDTVNGAFYRTAKRWSNTTSKHINKWLRNARAEERPQEFFDGLLEDR